MSEIIKTIRMLHLFERLAILDTSGFWNHFCHKKENTIPGQYFIIADIDTSGKKYSCTQSQLHFGPKINNMVVEVTSFEHLNFFSW